MSYSDKIHAGERAAQVLAGETAIADRNIMVLSDTVIAGARPFIARQFMAVLGSMDAEGKVWASLVFGKPGFLHTETGKSILVDVPEQDRDQSDPLWANLAVGADLGMLFIEIGTRRRYRVNGTVQQVDRRGVEVSIREAYPNCPKYIQRRHLRQLGEPVLPVQTEHGTRLVGTAQQMVRQADTLFLASHHAEQGADATHRGGTAGFIHIVDENTLRVPDYDGNSMFNTIGNFLAYPHAGLCIPDFVHGQLLQLTGTVTVQWHQSDPYNETGGTGRYWEFKVERWLLRRTPQQLEWEYLDASPFNPPLAP